MYVSPTIMDVIFGRQACHVICNIQYVMTYLPQSIWKRKCLYVSSVYDEIWGHGFFIYRRKRKTYTVIIYLGHLGTLRIVLYSGCQMDNWVRVSSLYSAFGTEGWAVSQLAGWCSVTAAWRPRDHCPVRGGVFCFCDSCPGHQGGQEEPEDTVSFTWLTAAR